MTEATDAYYRLNRLEKINDWLIEQTDAICADLCPGFVGTWQERAMAAREAARAVARTRKEEVEVVSVTKYKFDVNVDVAHHVV